MKKPCRKYAPEANPRPLFTFGKYLKTAIACKEFFYKSDILNKDYQKALKKLTIFFFRTACRLYVTCMYSYVIRMSLVCTCMSSICHFYVFACHLFVTRMYSYVIHVSLVCTRMPSVCHSYVLVRHPYVSRMYSCVIRMSLVCTRMSSVCHSSVVLP